MAIHSLSDFSDKTLIGVLSYCSPKTLLQLGATNRTFQVLTSQDSLWERHVACLPVKPQAHGLQDQFTSFCTKTKEAFLREKAKTDQQIAKLDEEMRDIIGKNFDISFDDPAKELEHLEQAFRETQDARAQAGASIDAIDSFESLDAIKDLTIRAIVRQKYEEIRSEFDSQNTTNMVDKCEAINVEKRRLSEELGNSNVLKLYSHAILTMHGYEHLSRFHGTDWSKHC